MKKEPLSLFDIRSAAACLLSLAVKQRFPSALLAGSQVTPLGFYCDFSLSTPFDSECLKQVEEVMLAWMRQKTSMQIREMVSLSAKEYFLFHKEPLLARNIEESSESTFFLAQIFGFMILSKSSVPLGDLSEIGAFCLQKIEKVGSKLRIYGTAFFEKKDLKDFLKTFEDHSSHIVLGREKELFEENEEGILWLPKGQELRSLLKKRLESEERSVGFKRISSIPISEDDSYKSFFPFHQMIFEKQKKLKPIKLSECATFCPLEGRDSSSGLLNPLLFQGIRSHVFCQKKDLLDELISYLHFMTKIFKILDFAFRPIFFEVRKGKHRESSLLFSKALASLGGEIEIETLQSLDGIPRVEWNVADGLGRSFSVASLCAISPLRKEEFEGFAGSICLSFERVIGLLLEKNKGNLPFWLSATQVKVMPLEKKHRIAAKEISKSLKDAGLRVQLFDGNDELKVVLRQALEEGIPYVVVIGDKEIETSTVTLRDVRAKQAQSLHLQELIEIFKKE